jgi:hypothetical protein
MHTVTDHWALKVLIQGIVFCEIMGCVASKPDVLTFKPKAYYYMALYSVVGAVLYPQADFKATQTMWHQLQMIAVLIFAAGRASNHICTLPLLLLMVARWSWCSDLLWVP